MEIYFAEGVSVGEAIRRLGGTKITYYRWRCAAVDTKSALIDPRVKAYGFLRF